MLGTKHKFCFFVANCAIFKILNQPTRPLRFFTAAPKTTDFIDTRRNVAMHAFKQKKLRRRSKSESNLACLEIPRTDALSNKTQNQGGYFGLVNNCITKTRISVGKLKLPLPSAARYNATPFRTFVSNNPNAPEIRVEAEVSVQLRTKMLHFFRPPP